MEPKDQENYRDRLGLDWLGFGTITIYSSYIMVMHLDKYYDNSIQICTFNPISQTDTHLQVQTCRVNTIE